MKVFWTDIMDKLFITKQEVCALILKNIWHRRNIFIFDNQFASPKQVQLAAKLQLEAYQLATVLEEGPPQTLQVEGVAAAKQWIRPRETFVKAKWDAALNTNSNCIGVGCIIRVSKGNALVLICNPIKGLYSPPLAKALALRRVMLMCQDLQIRDIIFQEDCLHMIEVANHDKLPDVELLSIVHDIHCFMEQIPS